MHLGLAELADIFFQPPTLTSDIFAALDQNQCLVAHLKPKNLSICIALKKTD